MSVLYLSTLMYLELKAQSAKNSLFVMTYHNS